MCIEVSNSFIQELSLIGIEKFPNEIGGLLLGKYSKDYKTAYVVRNIMPITFVSGKDTFERKNTGLKKVLVQAYEKEGLIYLGEWHTHPNSSTMFSKTDLHAMKQIANYENVQTYNPLLLILSISENTMNNFTFYLYDNNKLLNYE